MNAPTPKVFTIPAGVSFVDTLAQGLLEEVGDQRQDLAKYLILLPTRRACRSLRDAFLRQTDGVPLLLPRMHPFGDIDEEELFISGQDLDQAETDLTIPPAMSALKRQILLARTISKLPDFTKGPEQDMALAHALGQLMDQIHTEDLNLKDLPTLVDQTAFAEHWQITVDFLKILSEHWPNVLKEHGLIDAADRRNRLINALNHHWQTKTPSHPIIAAGSTGSIPSTAGLLKTVSLLPKGCVILPALGTNMDEETWRFVEEGHPQATIKHLLKGLDVAPHQVQNWPYVKNLSAEKIARDKLISHVMSPPECTDQWQKIHLDGEARTTLQNTLGDIKRYDCATPQEEAQMIALLLRETLEDKKKTAALITPDRNLARRVAAICKKWDITLDDSGGYALANSPLGTYLRISAQAMTQNLNPVSFLAFLKHDLNKGAGFENFRKSVRQLEREALRGTRPQGGIEGIKENIESEALKNFIAFLETIITEDYKKFFRGTHAFDDLLDLHLRLCENFSNADIATGSEPDETPTHLWQGEEGEAAALFFSNLRESAGYIPPLNGKAYVAIVSQLMKNVTLRPRFGTHPRLMILGQLEARLVQADRLILSGLNEGSWPPDPGHDPWMSRPMRKEFGLPTAERAMTLAAHDFTLGFGAAEVFLTRADRIDGTPTVPARWLQRLDTFLQSVGVHPDILKNGIHQKYLKLMDEADNVTPIERPAPTPPLKARPRKLSVTKIETWLKDPYSIYAEKILKLRKLDPIDQKPDAAQRGTIIHEILERFVNKYKKDIPDGAENDFITIARDVLKNNSNDNSQWSFWSPRLISMADWFIPHEREWRKTAAFKLSEVTGTLQVTENLNHPFTLTARADRIDTLTDGSAALIDYKSGGTYSINKIQNSELPQLPLEGMMVVDGGFAKSGVPHKNVGALAYWKVSGGNPPGEVKALYDDKKIETSIEVSRAGLTQLINVFDDPKTPYFAIPRLDNAPRFNDFEHLERVKEWAALGEDGNDGEAI